MSQRLLRAALGLRGQTAPTSLLLPIRCRSRCFNTTTQIDPPQLPLKNTPYDGSRPPPSSTSQTARADEHPPRSAQTEPEPEPTKTWQPSSPEQPLGLSESLRALLPHLAAQPAQYIRIHIHGFPYLVTAGDQVRLPFKMPGVVPGDVLRLNRASILGSRDFTLQGGVGVSAAPMEGKEEEEATDAVVGKAEPINGPQMLKQPPYIDERLYECRAIVLGADSEPMRIKTKKKRRNRRIKTVKSKHRYTLLRISELRINSIDDLEV